ncbi:hypothetical protein [Algoriphagus taiwanensis]|uniref:Uncharacterized protein n=1 Tax=Algoriphagus taiwanensis TaxID=1445656 RepID=A0ABQ6Q9J5_9BACT|nr:hypothetical protein Ataiwa_39350 [Algoriphagus taiwanensis]
MKKKTLYFASFCIMSFGFSLLLNLVSEKGSNFNSFFTPVYAQDEELEESGSGKTDWYYFDCPYDTGKYCSSVQSSEFCARSKKKPIGNC